MSSFNLALSQFLDSLHCDQHRFSDTLAFIDTWFQFRPTLFTNGPLVNPPELNHGSCKIFALAQLAQLSSTQTLLCFGEHYRNLEHSAADSHLNLRRLQRDGLSQLQFEHFPLELKEHA